MNEGAEEPEGNVRVALVICHIQTDMTTLNHTFLVMMRNLDTAFETFQHIVEFNKFEKI